MNLPRNAQIWAPGYIRDRCARMLQPPPKRVWLAIMDHWEPLWRKPTLEVACQRVQNWREHWPQIAESVRDSRGRPACYTFFFPEEEYRPEFIAPLAEMTRQGIADVEVHLHHDGEGRQDFIDRVIRFCHVLHDDHGLLRERDGKLRFGFIHGNWALDNSLPDGRWCGLNDEITLLRDLGCYADFTMPSAPVPSQSRTVNKIYWATDDPLKPKSFDTGMSATPGGGVHGDLLMVPGPLGLRWAERLLPRLETGNLAYGDPPSEYRVKRWIDLAPRLGEDAFVKLHTHGTQEYNSAMLLDGGLKNLFKWFVDAAERGGYSLHLVSAWEMYRAIEAICTGKDSIAEDAPSDDVLLATHNRIGGRHGA